MTSSLVQHLLNIPKIFLHEKTPVRTRFILIAALLYGIIPIDFIPDVIPLLGIADDGIVIGILLIIFLKSTKLIQQEIVQNIFAKKESDLASKDEVV